MGGRKEGFWQPIAKCNRGCWIGREKHFRWSTDRWLLSLFLHHRYACHCTNFFHCPNSLSLRWWLTDENLDDDILDPQFYFEFPPTGAPALAMPRNCAGVVYLVQSAFRSLSAHVRFSPRTTCQSSSRSLHSRPQPGAWLRNLRQIACQSDLGRQHTYKYEALTGAAWTKTWSRIACIACTYGAYWFVRSNPRERLLYKHLSASYNVARRHVSLSFEITWKEMTRRDRL